MHETEELLDKLEKELKELNATRKEKQDILDELTATALLMAKRLKAAKKLITGLGREKARWTDDRISLL